MRFSSRSCGSTLRILRLYLKVAIFQPELQEHAPRTTFVLKKLRFSSRSCRGPGGNRTRDRGIAKAGAQTTRQLPQAISRATKSHGATARALRHARSPQRVRRDQEEFARRHSESASTRTIPAEGSSGNVKNAKNNPQVLHRPRRSPQRVARAPTKTQKITLDFLHLDHADPRRRSRGHRQKRKKKKNTLEFLHLDHADPRRGSRGNIKHRKKNSSFCTSTTPIPAEGRACMLKIAKTTRVFAPRPRRSPQRVARECQKIQKPRVFAPRPRRSPQRVAFPIVGNIPTPRLTRDS